MVDTKTEPKVDASKENAHKAGLILDGASEVPFETDAGEHTVRYAFEKADFDFLCAFVTAANKRLPTRAAIENDKKRKRTKK